MEGTSKNNCLSQAPLAKVATVEVRLRRTPTATPRLLNEQQEHAVGSEVIKKTGTTHTRPDLSPVEQQNGENLMNFVFIVCGHEERVRVYDSMCVCVCALELKKHDCLSKAYHDNDG